MRVTRCAVRRRVLLDSEGGVRWEMIDNGNPRSASIPRLAVPFACSFPRWLHRTLMLLPRVVAVRLLAARVLSGALVPNIVVIVGLLFISKSGFLIDSCREVKRGTISCGGGA